MKTKMIKSRSAFTLIELIIVIGIISLFSTIALMDFSSLMGYINYSNDLNSVSFTINESKISVANGKVRSIMLDFDEEYNRHFLITEDYMEKVNDDGECESEVACSLHIVEDSINYNTKDEPDDDSSLDIEWQNGTTDKNLIINKIDINGNAENTKLIYDNTEGCNYILPADCSCVDESLKEIKCKISEVSKYKKYNFFISTFNDDGKSIRSNEVTLAYYSSNNLFADAVHPILLDKITARDVGDEDVAESDIAKPDKIRVEYQYPLGVVYYNFYKYNDPNPIPVKNCTLNFMRENYDQDDTYRSIFISD